MLYISQRPDSKKASFITTPPPPPPAPPLFVFSHYSELRGVNSILGQLNNDILFCQLNGKQRGGAVDLPGPLITLPVSGPSVPRLGVQEEG